MLETMLEPYFETLLTDLIDIDEPEEELSEAFPFVLPFVGGA